MPQAPSAMAEPSAVAQVSPNAPAAAQATGPATLPQDLSPWGMFMQADIVVKAVMIGLAFASLVTWTIWLAGAGTPGGIAAAIEPCASWRRRQPRGGARQILTGGPGRVADLFEAAESCSARTICRRWHQGAVAIALSRIEARASRDMARGTGCSPRSARPRPSSACSARCGAS